MLFNFHSELPLSSSSSSSSPCLISVWIIPAPLPGLTYCTLLSLGSRHWSVNLIQLTERSAECNLSTERRHLARTGWKKAEHFRGQSKPAESDSAVLSSLQFSIALEPNCSRDGSTWKVVWRSVVGQNLAAHVHAAWLCNKIAVSSLTVVYASEVHAVEPKPILICSKARFFTGINQHHSIEINTAIVIYITDLLPPSKAESSLVHRSDSRAEFGQLCLNCLSFHYCLFIKFPISLLIENQSFPNTEWWYSL